MDPQREIEHLLEANKATLERQNNHLVYRFPGGAKFVMAKTPSDHRAPHNALSDLKRVLRENGMSTGSSLEVEHTNGICVMEKEPPMDEPAAPPKSTMRLRIEAKVEQLESDKHRIQTRINELRTEIQTIDLSLEKITKLLVLVDDPDLEETLSMVIGPVKPTVEKREHKPAAKEPCRFCGELFSMKARHLHEAACAKKHPDKYEQYIASAVQVTDQLVLAATQTFTTEFTTADVIKLMTGNKVLEAAEESRVKGMITKHINELYNNGKVIRTVRAGGRGCPAKWRKVDLTRLKG